VPHFYGHFTTLNRFRKQTQAQVVKTFNNPYL
jgi:hypothetical protein